MTDYFSRESQLARENATIVGPAMWGDPKKGMTYGDWKGRTGPGAQLSGINPQFRPGYGKALSKAYAAYCESDEAPKTKGPSPVRAAKYAELAELLKARYPSRAEMAAAE
jgi:hypothetical protein